MVSALVSSTGARTSRDRREKSDNSALSTVTRDPERLRESRFPRLSRTNWN